MPASQFDPSLQLSSLGGPRGAGPLEPRVKVLSMQVWFFQNGGNGTAFASGKRHDTGPFEGDRWVIETGLEQGSDEFSMDEPVSAMALAIVEHPDGRRELEQWNQAVSLRAP
jgi:hypothetical protein